MAQHRGLSFNATHAPTQHAQAINHGGVRIGPYQSIGEGIGIAIHIARPHRLPQILQIHLVTNARTRRHDAEIIKRMLPPAQKLVALLIALHFQFHVQVKRIATGKMVNHHRVVYHQIHRRQGIDFIGVATCLLHGLAHRRQIHHRRHTRKVLHQHPSRSVLDFLLAGLVLQPCSYGFDVIRLDRNIVFKTQ